MSSLAKFTVISIAAVLNYSNFLYVHKALFLVKDVSTTITLSIIIMVMTMMVGLSFFVNFTLVSLRCFTRSKKFFSGQGHP